MEPTTTLTKTEYQYLKTIDTLNQALDKSKETISHLENKYQELEEDIKTKNSELESLEKGFANKYATLNSAFTELEDSNLLLGNQNSQLEKNLKEIESLYGEHRLKTKNFISSSNGLEIALKEQIIDRDNIIKKLNLQLETQTKFNEAQKIDEHNRALETWNENLQNHLNSNPLNVLFHQKASLTEEFCHLNPKPTLQIDKPDSLV